MQFLAVSTSIQILAHNFQTASPISMFFMCSHEGSTKDEREFTTQNFSFLHIQDDEVSREDKLINMDKYIFNNSSWKDLLVIVEELDIAVGMTLMNLWVPLYSVNCSKRSLCVVSTLGCITLESFVGKSQCSEFSQIISNALIASSAVLSIKLPPTIESTMLLLCRFNSL
ncbi:unnamed protein product [Prunus brigantina]